MMSTSNERIDIRILIQTLLRSRFCILPVEPPGVQPL
jgi:hypothetical protein